MTSFRQIAANRRNATKSTGPTTAEGKQRSRCNAVCHGLTAKTVIGSLEDAEDYKLFEAGIIADYDTQSGVERELVLRLASLLWRLRRAATMETGLFELQPDRFRQVREDRHINAVSQQFVHAVLGSASTRSECDAPVSQDITVDTEAVTDSGPPSADLAMGGAAELARCFVRLANLPNYALDRLSRYEATLWRQVGQTLFALNALDRAGQKLLRKMRRCEVKIVIPMRLINPLKSPRYWLKGPKLSFAEITSLLYMFAMRTGSLVSTLLATSFMAGAKQKIELKSCRNLKPKPSSPRSRGHARPPAPSAAHSLPRVASAAARRSTAIRQTACARRRSSVR